MTIRNSLSTYLVFSCICFSAASGQPVDKELSSFGFETIPADLGMVGSEITLEGNTVVEGKLQVVGEVSSTVGVRFPDGSLQTSANSGGLSALAASGGLYSNQIVEMIPPFDYTEVCIVGGELVVDLHLGGESTVDGQTQNCNPGDTGWIIERQERNGGNSVPWTEARLDCLLDGMRLAEPFEWQLSCDQSVMFGLTGTALGSEWASNHVNESSLSNDIGFGTAVFGTTSQGSGCQYAGIGFLGRVSGTRNSHQYRCAR